MNSSTAKMESKSNYKAGCFQSLFLLIFYFFFCFTLQKAVDTANKILSANTLEIMERAFSKSNSST